MKRILVWDIPIRIFHWLFAGSFLTAFAIANLVDDDSSLFTVHMFLGGVIAFMVLLRLVWGVVGSKYARFSSFTFSPGAILGYFKSAVTGGGDKYTGHNPGTAAVVFAMFVLVLGLAFTGVFMSRGEIYEEIHEILAWAMIVMVGAHVAGIIWHTIRHKENIAASMVHGRKEGEPSQAIRSSRAAVGVVFMVLTGLWGWGLYANYDAGQLNVPLTGQSIAVGEGEEHDEDDEHDDEDEEHDDEEHDDD